MEELTKRHHGQRSYTLQCLVQLDGWRSKHRQLRCLSNPSRDIFNVSFTSEDAQDLEVRVINVVGEVVYTENLRTSQVSLQKRLIKKNTKGIYF